MRNLNRRTFLAAAAGSTLAARSGAMTTWAQDGGNPTIGVGSKNYTEQIIMGETVALLLEDAGYGADRQMNLGGTAIAHQALMSGDIDTYVEYTGTGLVAILGMDIPARENPGGSATPEAGATPESDASQNPAYIAVAEAYPSEFNVKWLQPWGFNNTYTLAVRPETAEEYDLQTFSDLEAVAGELTLGTDQEFPIREDGLPAMEETYGFSFGDLVSGDIGLMYQALVDEEVDVIVAYATDGRIPAFGLVLLEDDLSFFPPYHSAPIIRQEVLDEYPEIEDVLNQPAGLISNETMAAHNAMVDDEGMEPGDAARSLLQEIGILAND